jgi:hypothetical protein
MTIWCVLCTGPSMSQAVADSVRHLRVIAVNGTFELAPWAEALVANDYAWWREHPKAHQFAGRKFSTNRIKGVERVEPYRAIGTCSCSGVLALEVAKNLGATKVLLLGADFHGSHYFGDYKNLKNTDDVRRQMHANQFALWKRMNPSVEVINCTPGSKLGCFPQMDLRGALSAEANQRG